MRVVNGEGAAGLHHSSQGTLNCLFLGIHVVWNCETEQCIKVHVSNPDRRCILRRPNTTPWVRPTTWLSWNNRPTLCDDPDYR